MIWCCMTRLSPPSVENCKHHAWPEASHGCQQHRRGCRGLSHGRCLQVVGVQGGGMQLLACGPRLHVKHSTPSRKSCKHDAAWH